MAVKMTECKEERSTIEIAMSALGECIARESLWREAIGQLGLSGNSRDVLTRLMEMRCGYDAMVAHLGLSVDLGIDGVHPLQALEVRLDAQRAVQEQARDVLNAVAELAKHVTMPADYKATAVMSSQQFRQTLDNLMQQQSASGARESRLKLQLEHAAAENQRLRGELTEALDALGAARGGPRG